MPQRINFLPLRDFFTTFTNIDYRTRTVDFNPAWLPATSTSRSTFSIIFFPLDPIST